MTALTDSPTLDGVVGIIPARMASTRLPGKPLRLIGGKPMVQHVWERAAQVLPRVIIATDHADVKRAARAFGAEVVMTSPGCQSGTERCLEVVGTLAEEPAAVVNLQGDEPLVAPALISELARAALAEPECVHTAANRVAPDSSEAIFDPDMVKVVLGADGCARWFSRAPMPWLRGVPRAEWAARGVHYTHHGIYAFGREALRRVAQLTEPTALELAESLEQLRWVEAGIPVKCVISREPALGVDTEDDLRRVSEICQNSLR